MLHLENIRVRQGSFTLSAHLTIAKGARVALMGASGSGKSTLLSTLSGFLWPDAGRITMAGADVAKTPVADRPISILFQDGNLFPHLSVFDNVALGIRPNLKLGSEDERRVTRALTQVGLEGMEQRKPSALSGGQQSRVALARMLLRDKPVALLDEPFSALDPGLRREMLSLVRKLCDETGQTLIMATHDLRDAERLCDRVLLLDDGKVVLDAPLAEAVANNAEPLRPWM
ncbi:thiamine ABC transporter ATP-binding protein [Jannaschia sp. CCS1]|uniref:Thiamine import ATP-binding protein ThiQ n=1 Tax=Jannaschia sp. (strain CCS1) TaxID=290400 RepID=THIQ_JANSC|nr:ATP-binding cassette domain-containing protein [Jannaschia sp. CCS1]Q28VL7.1 RecName: Full=Thiamine import ATP-binding protein ThiQ [Jannaschia sp. CCS1]ABD53245.1 ABC transporter related protein [Jannaschia sp. CCS1]